MNSGANICGGHYTFTNTENTEHMADALSIGDNVFGYRGENIKTKTGPFEGVLPPGLQDLSGKPRGQCIKTPVLGAADTPEAGALNPVLGMCNALGKWAGTEPWVPQPWGGLSAEQVAAQFDGQLPDQAEIGIVRLASEDTMAAQYGEIQSNPSPEPNCKP